MESEYVGWVSGFLGLVEEDAALLGDSGFIVNVDAFDGDLHWYPFLSPRDAGWRAALGACSDVVVKGGLPRWVLLSFRVPRGYAEEVYKGFIAGVGEFCDSVGCRIVGGDTDVVDEGALRVDVAVVGAAVRYIGRRGAKRGDYVVCTSGFGVSALVYRVYRGWGRCLEALDVYRRASLVDLDAWINVLPMVTSSIDNSDGLALSLYYLAEASDVGIVVEDIPLHPLAEKCGIGAEEALYMSGEEYQFIFTVGEDDLDAVLKRVGGYVLGRVVEGGGVRLADGRPIRRGGWVGGVGYRL